MNGELKQFDSLIIKIIGQRLKTNKQKEFRVEKNYFINLTNNEKKYLKIKGNN